MTLWSDIAVWRGPVLHHSGTIADHMYVVLHTADGSYDGTIAWQKNPVSGNSSHFVVAKDGRIAQVNDTANRSGAQIDGNPYSIAIENEGNENTPLTPQQVEACARILAKAHQVHGVPLQLTGHVGTPGLGHHSMGAESGKNWGHSQCPGSIIKAQKPAILARAIQIVGGNPPTPESTTTSPPEADMIYTVTDVPAGAKDCVGADVVNHSRCLATPAGPYSLNGTEAASLPAGYWDQASVDITWTRLQQLCGLLKPAPATFTDAQVGAIADKLVASAANGLTPADHAGIVADLKTALQQGTGA